ncbi:MAG: phosphate acyltransferase PlsX [Eggerthellaceae bacterium]|nr:phosphate acyltransferase PlsX [Eggerthellaceae bacterium]
MADIVTIAVDVMGGDNAPSVVLAGIEKALANDPELLVILCGDADVIEPFVKTHERVISRPTTQVIEMDETPAEAVRAKKDSSIVVAARLVKDGTAQGFFSAGNTGACLSAAILVMGRIKGIKRPALGQVMPGYHKNTMLIDVGANSDCKPEYLVQFGHMASIYMDHVMGVRDPQVALLNIGEEEEKGSTFAKTCYELMKASLKNFAGNCEGRDIMWGNYDIVVTDGFTGNVTLKTIEGDSRVFFRYIRDVFMASAKNKLAASAMRGDLAKLKTSLSPETFGGTPLLGVDGTCVIGHGSSNDVAISNGIKMAAKTARARVDELIAKAINEDE